MAFPIKVFKISGPSMEPTLKEGDIVVVGKFLFMGKVPNEGDMVVVKHPKTGKAIVKRVSRIFGEKIELLGDNEPFSSDSRSFGTVHISEVMGKVILAIKR